MERSFGGAFPKSPFSSKTPKGGGVKRPLLQSSHKKPSRMSISGRSTQSVQAVLRTQFYNAERFGLPLPVLVTEALTFADRNVAVSSRISENGYAWLVCGRRLLVWQYRHGFGQGTAQRKPQTSQCFELTLPQSDLAHRAELVSVFPASGGYSPSCLAVSPEGVVRYWPNIAHEGVSVEQTVDLQGQECDCLSDVGRFGSVLATTTCTVVLVQPQIVSGRHSLVCRMFRTSAGWLGGIGKRMSSLIFGPISTEPNTENKLVRVLSMKNSESLWTVFILAGHSLQKWIISEEPERLVYTAELSRMIRIAFFSSLWEASSSELSDVDTWLLDIQHEEDSVVILAACVNLHAAPQMHYALVRFETHSDQPPSQIRDFFLVKLHGFYQENNPAASLSYRFLLCGSQAYVYNQRSVTVVRSVDEPDTLDFSNIGSYILGGSICINAPVFFLQNHGLVVVSANDMNVQDLNTSLSIAEITAEASLDGAVSNLTLYSLDPEEIFNAHKDTAGQIKAAFIFHIKRQMSECRDIVLNLFPDTGKDTFSIDSTLDKVLVSLSRNMLNDIPANDPRWVTGSEATSGIGSSASMQIINQLQDKQKVFDLFVDFLHQTGLWNRLGAVSVRGTHLSTAHALCDYAEMIVAAISLKSLGTTYASIIDKAIERVADDLNSSVGDGLTYQDVFYREVTKVYRGLQALVDCCEDTIQSDLSPLDISRYIYDTNTIILSVLKEVIQYRQQKASIFSPSPQVSELGLEYLPWTSALGTQGLYDYLTKLQNTTLKYGAHVTPDSGLKSQLYDQFVNIIDLLLDGRKCHLESVRNTNKEDLLMRQYQNERQRLIQPLINDKEWERAALLAEKYLDFASLVTLCELTNNQQRLDEYMERFNEEGFSQFLFSWYMQENKQGKLMARFCTTTKPKATQKLGRFLSEHPSLSWMQQIYDKNYVAAAQTLQNLAIEEKDLVTRKKNMFSLCKLASLAADEDRKDYIEAVDWQIELIGYQEELPDSVLSAFGYDVENLRVLTAAELIHLYISNENVDANEYDYKKAIELLAYVEDDSQKCDLLIKIWCSIILKDRWEPADMNFPLEVLQRTMFYKLIELCLIMDTEPSKLLPPVDALFEASELERLKGNKNFQYLIKLGYEHVQNLESEM